MKSNHSSANKNNSAHIMEVFLKNSAHHIFLQGLAHQGSVIDTAMSLELPLAVQQFVKTTFSFFPQALHVLASVFVYGREAITSSLFTPLVWRLEQTISLEEKPFIQPLLYYLNRHIELDDNEHLPRALKMLNHLVGDDQNKWQDILIHARHALDARLDFLTDIQYKINESQKNRNNNS